MPLKTLVIAGLAAASLAACADYQARDRAAMQAPRTQAAPAAASDPIVNSGQTNSATSGSVSNTASGSRSTVPGASPTR